jgi:hypothetical protein
VANWQVWSTLTGAFCLLIAGRLSAFLAGLVHPHWSFLPHHCRFVVFSCRSGPPLLELPASSLQVCRLFFLQAWSTLTRAFCLLIAGMSSLLTGLVHPHWSFPPSHCRYVIFSCKLGPPSWASCLLIAGMSPFLAGLVHPHGSSYLLMAGTVRTLSLLDYALQVSTRLLFPLQCPMTFHLS